MVGNSSLVAALTKIKSYLDYGIFTPIQVAALRPLRVIRSVLKKYVEMYQSRRDILCSGLESIGWRVEIPKATMFVWAKIPEHYRAMGSLEFSKD